MSEITKLAKQFAQDGVIKLPEGQKLRDAAIDGPGVTVREHKELQQVRDRYAGIATADTLRELDAVLTRPVLTKGGQLTTLVDARAGLPTSLSINSGRLFLRLDVMGKVPSSQHALAYTQRVVGKIVEITVGAAKVRPGNTTSPSTAVRGEVPLATLEAEDERTFIVKDTTGKELARFPRATPVSPDLDVGTDVGVASSQAIAEQAPWNNGTDFFVVIGPSNGTNIALEELDRIVGPVDNKTVTREPSSAFYPTVAASHARSEQIKTALKAALGAQYEMPTVLEFLKRSIVSWDELNAVLPTMDLDQAGAQSLATALTRLADGVGNIETKARILLKRTPAAKAEGVLFYDDPRIAAAARQTEMGDAILRLRLSIENVARSLGGPAGDSVIKFLTDNPSTL